MTLDDRLELLQLPGRYGDAIDDRNWEALRRIFTPDAVFIVTSLNVEMNGLEEIIRYMDEDAPHPAAHLMMNVHIAQSGEHILLNTRAIFPISDGEEAVGSRVVFGSYYDRVVKTGEGWRVQHRLFSRSRVDKRLAKVDRAKT